MAALQIADFGTASNRFREDYGRFSIDFDGREIFKQAVKGMGEAIKQVLADTGLSVDDIDLFIPHQANLRIIESLARRFSLDMSRLVVNIGRYGNTSAASIPIALTESLEAGRIQPGSRLMLAAFGAGLTRAAGLVRWGDRTTALASSEAQLSPSPLTAMDLLAEAIENTQRT